MRSTPSTSSQVNQQASASNLAANQLAAKPSGAASGTPAHVQIKPRDRSHKIAAALATNWLDDDPFLTAFFNALSISFPAGEKFFIDSIRLFKDQVSDPVLIEEIKGFCGQEGFHRREHQRYNEALCSARGYDLDKLEAPIKKRIKMVQSRFPPETNLAGTVAIEHLTAVMAHQLLKDNQVLRNANPAMAELWRWHSAEEMEHKAVAFDVYRAVGGSLKARRRAMRRATFFFSLEVMRCLCYMLKKEGLLYSFKTWRRGVRKLLGKSGFLHGSRALYKEYFKAEFHPWNQDNSELLQGWSAETAASS
ncbi:MAG: metal-dependent hydrolase [Gammaproteobacteria bacterium]|nr:metal-dependent hydrolase [Gammaproteobacteria bacterium]MBT8151579.1 metal-dependent hydrolase [Gammaproteobacteria bacterium]NND39605.1 metal-dependent hydrolase [Pseudomonadales bacterium]NNM11510.1 metal-dependent hydrolase [Pseudomonadales bacterium]